MAEAYCVKDKKKVEVQNPQKITMKNGKPAHPGHLPGVRRQGLPDRAADADLRDAKPDDPRRNGGGRSMSGARQGPSGTVPNRRRPGPSQPVRTLRPLARRRTMVVPAVR